MDPKYPHLNLRDWPFQIVASPSTAQVWIGRNDFLKRLRMLERSARRVPSSQVVLLWASFGSGKSHALLYLQHLAMKNEDLIPLYVVIPEGVRSFLDVYRAIVDSALESNAAAAAGRWLFETGETVPGSDVERALTRIAVYGEEESTTASAWLRGDKVPMKDLRQIGIGSRIESTPEAITALNKLIQIMQKKGQRKVLLLLDEVQELVDLGKKLSECVGALHKIFDQNTVGLTMVLSFTTALQQSLHGILGGALSDRASMTLTLPPLASDEAVRFVEELIEFWSVDPSKSPYPFSRATLKSVISELENRAAPLTPRSVIKAFNQILREAEQEIEEGRMGTIKPEFALGNIPEDLN